MVEDGAGDLVLSLLKAQVARRPRAIAVRQESTQLTYAELGRRAGRLARHLRRMGVGPEVPVAICIERSVAMVVALFGVLEAGGCYVPLDPTYPADRLEFMLADSGARVLVTTRRLAASAPSSGAEVVCIDALEEAAEAAGEGDAREGDAEPAPRPLPEHLAYIIYTSGSTGRPKGVMIDHAALAHYTRAAMEDYQLGEDDRVLQFSSISFDGSVEEIYPCLAAGGTVVLRTDEMLASTARFLQQCEAWGVTVLAMQTAYWHELSYSIVTEGLRVPACVRLWSVGGERILPARLEAWRERVGPRPRLLNTYGPTEATVVCVVCDLSALPGEALRGEVPIGRAIRGVRACVLDEHLGPVPDGTLGELYVGGPDLARGYLGRPDLTAERFVPSPFPDEPGARLYSTGDLVRVLADGNLELVGRIDDQVKIRGFRVEPGEVEAFLSRHPAVRQVAVLAREDTPGQRRLVAYVVPSAPSERRQAIAELRQHARSHLPSHLVPSAFVLLEELPLTPGGKVDRRRLPRPDPGRHDDVEALEAPRSAVEKMLAAIWCEVLGLSRVGVSESFFDLGGHSLLATQVLARVRETFHVDLPLRALFEAVTIADLARVLEASRGDDSALKAEAIPLERVPREPRMPLSSAQQRLWFLDQLNPGHAFYNVPQAVRRLRGALDVPALERALDEIVRRHEALRTTFEVVDGAPAQVIHPHEPFSLAVVDLGSRPAPAQEDVVLGIVMEEVRRPFELGRGPLIRVKLLRLGEDDHILLLTLHHILCDEWSLGVLFTELTSLYRAFLAGAPSPLPELSIQVADHAAWERRWLSGPGREAQLAHWKQQLAGLPTLDLPTDHPRPAVTSHRGGSHPVVLPKALVEALTRVSQREGATLFMTLLAAFQTLIARYTGAEDIPVGGATANRHRREMEGLIGFFVNMLVLRADVSGNPTFRQLLRRVREVTLEAYAHQELPFEQLVDELQPTRDLGRHPLFQIGFTHYNDPLPSLDLPGLKMSPFDVHNGTSKLDLLLLLTETPEGVEGFLEYSTDLFEPATIGRMAAHLTTLLEAIAVDPDRSVWRLPLLTGEERRQMLVGWNDTGADYPRQSRMHDRFEAQARRAPEAVALTFEGSALTYGELDRRANQLARHLRGLGLGPEARIGVWMDRSLEMIVAVLGVLKAGGAYVPLDPSYPAERLAFMVEDAALPVILSQARHLESIPRRRARVICLDADREALAAHGDAPLEALATPGSLAYVIYTSGSTGQPKGVMVEHRGVCSLAEAQRRLFGVRPGSRVLQFSSLSFDASVWEIVMALSAGATLCLASRDAIMPGRPLLDLLRDERIEVATLPPSVLAALPAEPLPDLRTIIVAGEACPAELVARWAPGRRFFNAYGPTETTVCATAAECTGESQKPSIGRPIANMKIYILDERQEPVPVGVPGEIYIGGEGLARGYLNRPELTEQRYVPNPLPEAQGERLYRTGDLARYLPDGSVDFLGRVDQQIKLRGFRIELAEIESTLSRHPAVQSASVVAREDAPGQKRLVAYVVAAMDAEKQPRYAEWQKEQVYQWQVFYDESHRQLSTPRDPTFNISDWNSSYTGQAIPDSEMKEWVDRTVERILALGPGRTLEIGCGTGLLMFRVAPRASRYLGTDFSLEVVRYLERQLERLPEPLPQVELRQGAADEIGGIEPGSFDTVVMNSVIQYFPSVEYLVTVLERAVSAVGPGGSIFVGDVRSLPLLAAYHASVQLHRAPDGLAREDLLQRVRQRAAHEEELTLSPAFFAALQRRLPRISDVRVALKRGENRNEMTRFRYDVTLRIEAAPEAADVRWIDWGPEVTPEAIRRKLAQDRPAALGVRGVPNARVLADVKTLEWLERGEGPATAGEMREALARLRGSERGVEPEAMWALCEGLPYRAEVTWAASPSCAPGCFDAVFTRADAAAERMSGSVVEPPAPGAAPLSFSWREYANRPLQAKLAQKLVPDLRRFAQDKLPSYMVPATFVLLDAAPLSPSGKLNPHSLPAPTDLRKETDFIAPRTELEHTIAGVWQEVLQVDSVGVNDNFFDLGGNSLLTAHVQMKLQASLGRGVTLVDLFAHHTVGLLARALGARGAAENRPAPAAKAAAGKPQEDLIARQGQRLQSRRRRHA